MDAPPRARARAALLLAGAGYEARGDRRRARHRRRHRRARRGVREAIGKTTIKTKDRSGFIVNLLLVPYLMAAVRMYEDGFATPRGHRRGDEARLRAPDGAADAVRLHRPGRALRVCDSLYEEFKRHEYAPPPLMKRMVVSGHLGRKTGPRLLRVRLGLTAHAPSYVTLAGWALLELSLRVRERLHGRGGTGRDRHTRVLIAVSVGATIALAAVSASHAQSLRMPSPSRWRA